MAQHPTGRPGAQHLHVINAVATGQQAVHDRQDLTAWMRRARPVAKVDQLVGGLLQAEPVS
jgi:hypothetical protein